MTEREKTLLDNFRKLNEHDKDTIAGYAAYLVAHPSSQTP